VGRPNTGKSTLFNRLTHSRAAIVSNVPGTTRDRREGHGHLAGIPLNLIDTGGLDDRGAVSQNIQEQVAKAFQSSDVVLFMLDGKAGVTALDMHFAQWIRRLLNPGKRTDGMPTKSVIVVANKTEGAHMSARVMDTVSDALELGFGDPILISATHGDGLADLSVEFLREAQGRGMTVEVPTKSEKRKMFKTSAASAAALGDEGLPPIQTEGAEELQTSTERLSNKIPVEDRTIQLAIMGRPNVGKSTLLNAFVREERSITGPLPGLTRDAVQAEWQHRDRQFRLVDTAGLTRIRTNKQLLEAAQEKKHTASTELTALPSKNRAGNTNAGPSVKLPGRDIADPELDPSQFSYQISEYALISALNALRFAQVVLLVVEGGQGKFSKLDLQLARKCLEEGRGLVIAANKSDVVEQRGVTGNQYEEGVREHIGEYLREFGEVPVVVSSGTERRGIDRLLNTVIGVHDAWSRRVDTGSLNSWLRDLLVTQPAPRVDGKALNVKYITQVKSRPPTFALFTNQDELPIFFERFLKSNIQTAFSLQGVPVRFVIRKTKGVDIHRNRRLVSKSKAKKEGAGRSAKSPTGLGSWKAVSRGASVKKGVVGPRRKQKRLQRRIASIVRHKRKSAEGTGMVNISAATTKESAQAKVAARTRAKASKQQSKQGDGAADTGGVDTTSGKPKGRKDWRPPVPPKGRMKKTSGGIKKVAKRVPYKEQKKQQQAKKAKAKAKGEREGSNSKRNTKSARVKNRQSGRRSRGGGRRR
jgi:GTP-binding protein